jgi:single-strand DNA-binding protein
MAQSVNEVTLLGNLGRDAETKFTPSGIAVTRFSIATTRSWKDQQTNQWKEETNWTNVTAWRKENLANYLTKGKQVFVQGRLRNYSYADRDGNKVYATEVVAEKIVLCGGAGNGNAEGAGEARTQSNVRPAAPAGGLGRSSGAPVSGDPAQGGGPQDWEGQAVTDDDVPW